MPDPSSILYGALVAALVGICVWRLRRVPACSFWWCLPAGLLLAGTGSVHAASMSSCYYGLMSDAAFQIALINRALHGRWLADCFDPNVVTHYPPLWFWAVGIAARGLDMTALQIARWTPCVVLAALPLMVAATTLYVTQRQHTVGYAALATVAFTVYHARWFLETERGWGLLEFTVHKPYEVIAGLASIAWVVWVVRSHAAKWYGHRTVVLQGVVAGIILLMYYPWLAVAVAAVVVTLSALRAEEGPRALARPLAGLSVVMLIAAVVASPWLGPFAKARLADRTDTNYGGLYFTHASLDPTLVTTGLGHFGLLFGLGGAGVWMLARRRAGSAIVGILAVSYTWWASSFVTIPIFGRAFLGQKATMLILLCFATTASLVMWTVHARVHRHWLKWLSFPVLWVICLPLLPTIVTWNAVTDRALARAYRDTVLDDAAALAAAMPQRPLTVLGTAAAVQALPALSDGVRLYISPNIHYSNPLADYARRSADVLTMIANLHRGGHAVDELGELGIDILVLQRLPSGQWGLRLASDARWGGSYEDVPVDLNMIASDNMTEILSEADIRAWSVGSALDRSSQTQ